MQKPTTDRERIDFALRTERDGHEFYQMAAKRTAHKLAKAAFELLSREELRHVALIEALDKGLAAGDEAPKADEVTLKDLESSLASIYKSASEETNDVKFDAAEAYQKAIELEKRITSLYTDYMMESDDEGARRLFAVLQKEEQHHLSLLQNMHAYLTKPGDWFIDRDGILLDGG